MEFEILKKEPDVRFSPAKVGFPSYEKYKAQATAIAEYIGDIEVTPENVKEVKKTLAQARKITDGLNRKRIDIKKAVLEDFSVFEDQVKELSRIVDEADSKVRAMVKTLEEEERVNKRKILLDVWNKRITMYENVTSLLPDPFNTWLQPKHLNKTTTLTSVERDMVEWLEKKSSELATMKEMGDAYLTSYIKTGDMVQAIKDAQTTEQIHQMIRAAPEEPEEQTAVFVVKGSQQITLTELLLKTNNIEYQRR